MITYIFKLNLDKNLFFIKYTSLQFFFRKILWVIFLFKYFNIYILFTKFLIFFPFGCLLLPCLSRHQKGDDDLNINIDLTKVDQQLVKRLDMYVKSALVNALRNKKNVDSRPKRHDVSFTSINEYEDSLVYLEKGFTLCEHTKITIFGYSISITNYSLSNALSSIPENHKTALLLNTLQQIPLCTIAEMLGVTERTIKNYKKLAIEEVRSFMNEHSE